MTYADKLIRLNKTDFSGLTDYLHYVLDKLSTYDDPNTSIVLEHPDKMNKTVLEQAYELSRTAPRYIQSAKERLEYTIILDETEIRIVSLLDLNTFWLFSFITDFVIYQLIHGFDNIVLPFDDLTRARISMWNSTRLVNKLRNNLIKER